MTYATLADVLTRYPAEATVLAADEQTRQRSDVRIEASLVDAALEIRAVLTARYTPAELANLDADSRAVLSIYQIDIALYRVALSFGRSNERVKERYDAAIKRLEAIAAGKGALTFEGSSGGVTQPGEPSSIGPGEPVVEAPERIFTRDRLRGW
ncbi:phage protein Gp36 family protein [Xanthobacter sp. 126]|uniref:gp436 family protein n=1 Tax=Xanthobacter sp. 126 TaxID=1131814 RepID=UPI00045E7F19|nr:phage protein Gp36 family protein [Xanthobacter sp. 126]